MAETIAEKRKRGRPRKHTDGFNPVRAYRDEKQAKGRRLDLYVSTQASWRLTALSKAWGCSRREAVERLLLEADDKYGEILFPETIFRN